MATGSAGRNRTGRMTGAADAAQLAANVAAIDAALCARHPTWTPLCDADRHAIVAAVLDAPEITDSQALHISRVLRGSPNWRNN